MDYCRFINNVHVLEGGNITGSRVDQLFKNSILLRDPRANQPIVMYRWSFLESLIRLAAEKYIETKQAESYADAFQRLIEKEFVPNLNKIQMEPWQELREDYIWTIEIDDLLRANLEGL